MDALLRRFRPEQVRELVLLVVIVLVIAFFATQIPNYLSGRTLTRVMTTVPIIVVVAVGQTLVVLTRNIDLSVGAIVGVVAYSTGAMLTRDLGMNPVLAVALSVTMGAAMGAFNGMIVAYGRVPAIVATLGSLWIFRSLLVAASGSKPVTTANLPEWLVDLNGVNLASFGDLDIRVLGVVALVAVIVFQLLLSYLGFGRRLFAIGSNPDAARLAGLPVARDVFLAFTACGALAGLGGFMYLVRFGNIDTQAALGLELDVVAAVVVGGVNIFGGSGSLFGVLLGAILLTLLDQSLIRWLAVSEFLRDALLGLLILLAVASDKIILERLRTTWVRSRRAVDVRSRAEKEARPPEVAGG